ncbi:MAG: hypothetical protein K0V04_08295 [Deltaproteobacteria bacterium]|nr:hypothetical protein [Deltaproteobacteria bacterium]
MSRYVQVATPALHGLDVVAEGLAAMGLSVQRERRRVMLEGSVECSGEPVDLRLPAGTLDTVEDFGFVQGPEGLQLVCGELDRALLEERLLPPLQAVVAEQKLRGAAERAGMEIESTTEADGRRRLVVRRRG